MTEEQNSRWYSNVIDAFDGFLKQLDEKIEVQQQQLKDSKKKSELEIKLTQEMKLNDELTARLAELNRRSSELDRVSAAFSSGVTIADSDKSRLENVKELYQVAKELTDIRLDFSASPSVAKGYIKSVSRKLLLPFELPANDSDALWSLLQSTRDTENRPPSNVNTEHKLKEITQEVKSLTMK